MTRSTIGSNPSRRLEGDAGVVSDCKRRSSPTDDALKAGLPVNSSYRTRPRE